jgi:hypothetical protein
MGRQVGQDCAPVAITVPVPGMGPAATFPPYLACLVRWVVTGGHAGPSTAQASAETTVFSFRKT